MSNNSVPSGLTLSLKRTSRPQGFKTAILPALIALFISLFLPPLADANPDNWDVEGEHGELHVFGALTEGACRLDMESQYQEVELGETARSLLDKPGDQGMPVTFHLQLRDCGRTGGRQRDLRQDNLVMDTLQPVLTVSFVAPTDPDFPQLVKVRGVSGIGLRLRDSKHHDIRPGDRGAPQFVTPSNDELVYTVVPERTAAPLSTGRYRATVDFRLNYD